MSQIITRAELLDRWSSAVAECGIPRKGNSLVIQPPIYLQTVGEPTTVITALGGGKFEVTYE